MVCQAICSSAQAGSFHFTRKAELVAQMVVRLCGSGGPGVLQGTDEGGGSRSWACAGRAQHLLGPA